jgi:xylan 1,4-beta-xylosidase
MIQNPILKGFCPDPSIIRVKDDYYIATSTFEWWPGVRLWHSKDLKNWEQKTSPLNRESQLNLRGIPSSGGIWAPDLSYNNGTFFLIYTVVTTHKIPFYNTHNYLVTAKNIDGPWSEPVYLQSRGFDPSLFHDQDGKTYVITMVNGFKGIILQEYSLTSQTLVGEISYILTTSYASKTEGPHLYHFDDYYYLVVAEGGTGINHQVSVLRSKTLRGTYVRNPNNPLITSVGFSTSLRKAGHGSIVQTQEGEYYLAYLCARTIPSSNLTPLGRETALARIILHKNGWFSLATGTQSPATTVAMPTGLREWKCPQEPDTEYFCNETHLPLWWSTLRTKRDDDIAFDGLNLILHGRESLNSLQDVTLIAKRCIYHNFSAETRLSFNPHEATEAAGISYFYNTENFIALVQSVDEEKRDCIVLITNQNGTIHTDSIPVSIKHSITFKLDIQNGYVHCYYATEDDEVYHPLSSCIDASCISDEKAKGFTGAQIALYCHDMTGQRSASKFEYLKITALQSIKEV